MLENNIIKQTLSYEGETEPSFNTTLLLLWLNFKVKVLETSTHA